MFFHDSFCDIIWSSTLMPFVFVVFNLRSLKGFSVKASR